MSGNPSGKVFKQTARPSEISSNWRKNVDTSPKDGVNDSAGSRIAPLDRALPTNGSPGKDNKPQEAVRSENDPDTLLAIAEGRRLYVGNMPYFAKVKDVEELFAEGDYVVVHVNMSIDPYTGRNPSYCFVELETKAQADGAMEELKGINLLGRPVKIGPGVARSSTKRPRAQFDQGRQTQVRRAPVFDPFNRTDAAEHWTGYSEQGRRLWVGGLPRMDSHLTVNNGVRDLFKGFKLEAVSKVIIPTKPAFGDARAWNHRYLFVDFSTAEEAARAASATNGKQAWGVKIRVMPARPSESGKIGEREAWQQEEESAKAEVSSVSFKQTSDSA